MFVSNVLRSLAGTSFGGVTSTATIRNLNVSKICDAATNRSFHRSAVSLLDSTKKDNSTDPDGFSTENLDPEAKEKLQALKNDLAKNAYFEKYKGKIVQHQRNYPMEFLALLEGLKTSKQKSKTEYVPKMTTTKKRKLEEVMKVNLLMELERDDISFIWHEFHHKNGLLGATMPGSVFERVIARTDFCDTFVLPLDRKTGHDFHLVQFSSNIFHFTPLVSWQAYKENSPVSLTLTFFDELKKDKDVVLMRGEFDKNIFTQKEAQDMAIQIHLYYAEPDFQRNIVMEKFVSQPSEFQHTDLLAELERMRKENKELFGTEEQ